MDTAPAIAMLIVLTVAIAAIVFLVRKQSGCPAAPVAVSFWTTPDDSSVLTGIACPPGSVIAVQNADYGAPWSQCAWTDVTERAGALMNGQNAYTIPPKTSAATLLGVPDPCAGTGKTFAGSYACVAPPGRSEGFEDRENFSPDAPGACAARRSRAARAEAAGLRVAAGSAF